MTALRAAVARLTDIQSERTEQAGKSRALAKEYRDRGEGKISDAFLSDAAAEQADADAVALVLRVVEAVGKLDEFAFVIRLEADGYPSAWGCSCTMGGFDSRESIEHAPTCLEPIRVDLAPAMAEER